MIKKYAVQYAFYVPDDQDIYCDTQTVLGEYDTYGEAWKALPVLFDELEDGAPTDGTYYDAVFIGEVYYDDEHDEGNDGDVLLIKFPDWCPDDVRALLHDFLCERNNSNTPQL